jgi:hypothetical protein
MNFVIESGVAPVSNKRGRKSTEFPLGDMSVGDSFMIPTVPTMPEDATAEAIAVASKKLLESWRRKVLIAKKAFCAEFEGKYQTAVVDGGLRVWRTE